MKTLRIDSLENNRRKSYEGKNLPLGHAIVLATNGRYDLNLVVKSRANERPFLNIFSVPLYHLKEAMLRLKIRSAKVCRAGNDLDQINWASLE